MKKVLYFLAACFVFVSCSKDTANPSTEDKVSDYFPVSAGNYWKFKDSASGSVTTLSATGAQKSINGSAYYVVNTSNASGTVEGYVLKKNNFYSFVNLFGTSIVNGALDFRYLNDTLGINSSWNYNAGSINSIPATVKGKIVARGISKTVNNVVYNNVIFSQMSLFYDYSSLGMGLLEVGRYDIYSAKGVGIIKVQSSLPTNPLDPTSSRLYICSNLVEYSIK